MEKRVLSFRVSEAEITALEALQQPEDSSLGQTALRLLRGVLGVQTDTPVNTVDTHGIKDRVESLEDKLTDAIINREQLSDLVNDVVDKRIQLALDTLSDHENRLISIEQAQEVRSHLPVSPKVTTPDVTPALLQEELEGAIAPKATEDNIVSALAGKKISSKKLKSIATSLQNTFREDGIEISQTIIKEKVLEMYPNPDDWYPRSNARDDVKRALQREHK
jgi:hypothetical protein